MKTEEHGGVVDSDRAKILLAVATGGMGMMLGVISSFLENFLRLPTAMMISVSAGMLLPLFTAIIARLVRGDARVADVKKSVAAAYEMALDESPLNPSHRVNK